MSSFEQRKWTEMSTAEVEGHALWPVRKADIDGKTGGLHPSAMCDCSTSCCDEWEWK
jgi:hypothetical protein